jgi:hypothetical protein
LELSHNGRVSEASRKPYGGSRVLRGSFYSQANISEDQIMGFFSKDIESMDDLFVHTLRDIYYAEQKIVRSLADHDRKGHGRATQGRF